MDNLPTFSDLTQNKQEQTVKKKEDIKLSPSLLTKSTSAVKEIQVKEVSTNLETKSKQEPKSPILETKQEAKSPIPETKQEVKSPIPETKQEAKSPIPETKQEAKSPIPETKLEAKSTTPETTETKQEPMTIITPPENKQKIKLESKQQQMKVTIEKETDGKWMYCKVKGCHFWTRKQIRMDRHEKSHVPGDDKFYQCPECQLKICSLSKLLRHDRKFHTGFKDYECKICEAEVTDIAVHMRVSNAFFLFTHPTIH